MDLGLAVRAQEQLVWLHTCFVGLQPGGDMAMHYGHWVQVVSAVHAELRKCGDAVQEATSTDSQLAAQQLAASEQFQAYLAGGGPTASLICRRLACLRPWLTCCMFLLYCRGGICV